MSGTDEAERFGGMRYFQWCSRWVAGCDWDSDCVKTGCGGEWSVGLGRRHKNAVVWEGVVGSYADCVLAGEAIGKGTEERRKKAGFHRGACVLRTFVGACRLVCLEGRYER